jgi:hypothetical protein
MKYLLIALAGVVFLILCVVVIGSLLPKRHVVSRQANYRATPEQLFSLIAGPQSWRPDVKHWEALPNNDGHELTRETSRGGETIDYELLERLPNKSLKRRIATANLPYSGSWTYTLEPSGETTTVRITEDGEVHNPIFRFVSRFILGHTSTIDSYLRVLGTATSRQVSVTN